MARTRQRGLTLFTTHVLWFHNSRNRFTLRHDLKSCMTCSEDGTTVRRYRTVRLNFCQEVRYLFFVMVRKQYVGSVRLFCNRAGTVRLVRCLNEKSQTFPALRRLFVCRGKRQLKPTLNV